MNKIKKKKKLIKRRRTRIEQKENIFGMAGKNFLKSKNFLSLILV